MDAKEFNLLYDELVFKKLDSIGFVKEGNSLFLNINGCYVALIRNSFRGTRVARLILCLRHSFTRDLFDNTNNLFATNPNDYPFKIKPTDLLKENLKNWHYKTWYINSDTDYDLIHYGADFQTYGEISRTEAKLADISNNIYSNVLNWVQILTPQESLKQLQKYNQGDRVEFDWIDDYKKYVSSYEDFESDRKVVKLIDIFRRNK